MNAHANDPDVFIRSLATRGALGGLSRSTYDVVHVMDAMGFDIILVETVGVGQDELDIMKLAETCVVILVPGMGDDVQAIKAGILEVADVFVVNKADHPEVHRTIKDLRYLQSLLPQGTAWMPPIHSTIATTGEGIEELDGFLSEHRGDGSLDVKLCPDWIAAYSAPGDPRCPTWSWDGEGRPHGLTEPRWHGPRAGA